MKRIEWLFGFAALALVGLGVAYCFRPKEDDGQGPAPPTTVSTPPSAPADPEFGRLLAANDELVRVVEKLGGSCGKLWEPKWDEAWYAINLPTKTTDADLKQLPRLQFECWLSLWGSKVTDAGLATLKSQPRLLTLDLSDTKITGNGLKELAECESLVDLHLGGTPVRDADLEHLAGFRCLHSLRLNHTRITDAGLKHLQRISTLRKLNINFTDISREGLWLLREFPSLKQLEVAELDWLTVSDMTTIGLLSRLEKLHIGFSPVTDEGGCALGNVKVSQITHPDANARDGRRGEATSEGITELRNPLFPQRSRTGEVTRPPTRFPMPPLSDAQVREYHDAGFVLARGFYTRPEIDLLSRSAKEDNELDKRSFGRADGEGGVVRLSLWNHPGDGIYGMFARCERIVRSCEKLLADEVYHYHSKMILKDAKVGGAWAWHQDYGYWYQNGVLEPRLTSVFIAVDPSTRANGCLQVIRNSHLAGRVNHVLTGDQAGADRERVDEMLKRPERFPLVYVEMDPGDALFFHSNLLHRSDQNTSDHPRWSMICCYNARSNDPYKDSHHPRYTPLNVVPDDAIMKVGVKRFADSGEVAWLEDKRDTSAKALAEADAK